MAVQAILFPLPSGELTFCHGKSPNFSWENPLLRIQRCSQSRRSARCLFHVSPELSCLLCSRALRAEKLRHLPSDDVCPDKMKCVKDQNEMHVCQHPNAHRWCFYKSKCWPGSQPLNLMAFNLLDQNCSHVSMPHADSNEVASFLAALL